MHRDTGMEPDYISVVYGTSVLPRIFWSNGGVGQALGQGGGRNEEREEREKEKQQKEEEKRKQEEGMEWEKK